MVSEDFIKYSSVIIPEPVSMLLRARIARIEACGVLCSQAGPGACFGALVFTNRTWGLQGPEEPLHSASGLG